MDMLKLIFRENGSNHAEDYRVHLQELEHNSTDVIKGKEVSRTLSWWCFNPGVTMQEIAKKGVGSIILTSGTLSPMGSLAQELKLEFPVWLENPHVISSNQLWAGVVSTGPSGWVFLILATAIVIYRITNKNLGMLLRTFHESCRMDCLYFSLPITLWTAVLHFGKMSVTTTQ